MMLGGRSEVKLRVDWVRVDYCRILCAYVSYHRPLASLAPTQPCVVTNAGPTAVLGG